MREVTETLVLGDMDDAELYSDGFTRVVSLVQSVPEIDNSAEVTHIPLTDDGENPDELFASAVDAVREANRSGEMTLVHCGAGASRSVTVAATAIAAERDYSLDACLDRCSLGTIPPNPELVSLGEAYLSGE